MSFLTVVAQLLLDIFKTIQFQLSCAAHISVQEMFTHNGGIMKKVAATCFIIMLFLQLSTGVSLADRAEDCQVLVAKAVDFIQDKGPEYAFKVFSAMKGPFIDRELYIFVCSLDNVMLGHPYRHDLIGQNVSEHKDVKGSPLFQEFKKAAQERGEGWVDYWWGKPGEKGDFAKASFIKRVPGQNLYVGAGYYKTAGNTGQ
jgi:cytochrome c